MYLEHFGLREAPFGITPDTGFFFAHGHYAQALNTLLVALRTGEGFIKVVGEVGTGKTLLCRKLLNALDSEWLTAYVPNPMLSPAGLYMAVADELGLALPGNMSRHRVQKAIADRLLERVAEGRRVVLCVDEAQAMPLDTLEAVRLLTNLETEKHKLLQVVLFGQPELDERLNGAAVRQLRQRITFAYTLQPMSSAVMDAYVGYRLGVAGCRTGNLFRPAARRAIYAASRGIPRLINILCHKSLLAAYGRGAHVVDPGHVRMAVEDTEVARELRVRSARRRLSAAVAVGVAALGGALAYLAVSH